METESFPQAALALLKTGAAKGGTAKNRGYARAAIWQGFAPVCRGRGACFWGAQGEKQAERLTLFFPRWGCGMLKTFLKPCNLGLAAPRLQLV